MMKKLLAAALFWCAGTMAFAGNTPVTFQIDRTLSPSPVCVLRLTSGPCAIIGYVSSANVWTPTGPGGNSFAASAYTDTTNASNITSGTLPAARLPAPTTTARGGVLSAMAPLNQFQTGVDTTGAPTFAQVPFTSLSGTIGSAQIPSALTLNSPSLTGTPNTPSLTGYLYGNGGTGWTAAATIPTTVLSGTLQAAQTPAYTGDVTSPAGSTVNTLATVNTNVGSFGGASAVPTITLDGKGRATAATSTAVIAPAGTLSGTTLNATVVNSSLQTLGTGAAANNVGTLGGDLTGSLPSPTIGNAVVSNAKLAATMPTLTLKANITAGTAGPTDATFTAALDAAFGSARGSMLFRGATAWIVRTPTATGQVPTFDGTDTSFANPSAAVAPPRSNVRQTVQGGPQSSGAPSFLPSTTASLSITSQNVSTGANALTITAPNPTLPYNTTGLNDYVYQTTSNLTWSSLTASTTNYLYVNASSGATGSTTVVPIYQFGGTPSTVSGQFTFDYQAMIGYLGNGTSAVATPLVFVGEAVTSASGVTSTIAYAYNGYYESAWTGTAPAITTATSYASNLGVSEATPNLVVEWTTATGGYAVGERIPVFVYDSGNTTNANLPLSVTRLTASFTTGNVSAFYYYAKGGSFARGAIAAGATTVRFKMVAKRNF